MKFPPFTPSKYLFALHFKIKFPPLPTSKLALAFRPPYPKWLPCNSLMGMKQSFITKEKDKVIPAKCNIYTFRGRLHLDLHDVQIISPMGIGKKPLQFLEQVINFIEILLICSFVCLQPSLCKQEMKKKMMMQAHSHDRSQKQGHHQRQGRHLSQRKITYEIPFSFFVFSSYFDEQCLTLAI